ncbi:MAG: hypothetical protein LBQ88_01555 [Treponema sp.]|jgi:hypothetical protein|nr:hypothetical protein [Treponema sp.]
MSKKRIVPIAAAVLMVIGGGLFAQEAASNRTRDKPGWYQTGASSQQSGCFGNGPCFNDNNEEDNSGY